MKKALIITAFLLVLVPIWATFATENITGTSGNIPLTGEEQSINTPYIPIPPGAITDSPGEIVGYTQYDFQSNGSTGTRIAIDANGGKHFTWTNAITYPSPRHIYYNYVDSSGNWLAPLAGVQVNAGAGAGFTQEALFTDGRAAVTFHQASLNFVTLATEGSPGNGVFSLFDPPDMLVNRCYWPYIGVDRSNRIHIVSTENITGPQVFGYTASTDGGTTWSTFTAVDTLRTISPVIVTSRISDKVAIVYTHPIDINVQANNDIYYIVSLDGLTWDFANGKVNVTSYDGNIDSIRAYADLDAVLDFNDDLQVVWNAGRLSSGGGTSYRNWLYHYNEGAGTINLVAEQPTDSWTCNPDAWSLGLAKPSIGVSSSNEIFITYTRYDTSDYSASFYCNGDIFMSYSADGSAWATPVNMTNTQTPGCLTGDCDADNWSSLAEVVDANLHLFYVNDKDAGARPQNQGGTTDNPMLYLSYPNPLYVAPVDRAVGLAQSGNFAEVGVSNYGILGSYDDQNYTYNWNSRGAFDYEGSFVLGNSGSTMMIEYGIGTGTHGFRPRTALDLTDTFHPQADFDDSTLYGGLHVEYNGHGFTGAETGDIFIHEYVITNNSGAPVSGLYAGNYFDWDIGGTDVVTFDRTNNVVIQGPTSGPFYGVEVVSGPVNTLMGVSNFRFIYNQQGWIGDSLYYFMGQNADVMPSTYADMSSLVSFGPFDLAGGASQTVAFAVIGGSSRADVSARAVLAQATYNLMYSANAVIAPEAIAHSQAPDQIVDYPADFTIGNNGGIPLSYAATNSLSWISLGGLTGIVPPGGSEEVLVNINTTGLAPGVYYDSVTIVSNDFDTPTIYKPVFTITVEAGGCPYIVGDINANGVANGIDVTYGVSFFKGGRVPPIDCGAPVGSCPQPSPFFAAGDVNGNCAFNGIDITYFVGYLKGGPALQYCADCPPAGAAPAVIVPGLRSSSTMENAQ